MKYYKPMLAYPGDTKIFETKDFIYEPKLDGTRAICYIEDGRVKIFNRRDYEISARYPEIVENLKKLKVKNCVLDGEIVVLTNNLPDFYKLQEREHIEDEFKAKLLAKKYPATLFVFDIIYLNDEELILLPLIERKKILDDTVKKDEHIDLCIFTEDGKRLFELTRKMGLEGIMAKLKRGLYHPGKRVKEWLKLKHFQTMDCVICGYTKGKGKREGVFGALVLGTFENGKLICRGKVGTGWSNDFAKWLKNQLDKIKVDKPHFDFPEEVVWVKPVYLCEVQFMEITEDGKLRAPSFKRLRFDKKQLE